jgi:hypothetical protein
LAASFVASSADIHSLCFAVAPLLSGLISPLLFGAEQITAMKLCNHYGPIFVFERSNLISSPFFPYFASTQQKHSTTNHLVAFFQ